MYARLQGNGTLSIRHYFQAGSYLSMAVETAMPPSMTGFMRQICGCYGSSERSTRRAVDTTCPHAPVRV